MIIIESKTKETNITEDEFQTVKSFLFQHLEHYGDSLEAIEKALQFALGKNNKPGGCIFIAKHKETEKIVGVAVILHTLMGDFIPENILVYIATDAKQRGKGVGTSLLNEVVQNTKGGIALHVDQDNPAQHLYTKIGFEKKYIEMRLKK